MLNLQTITMNYRREFWEYRRWLVGLPLVISGLMLIAAITMVIMAEHKDALQERGIYLNLDDDESAADNNAEIDSNSVAPQAAEKSDSSSSQSQATPQEPQDKDEESEDRFWYMGAYFMFVWLAALFYLLNSLYSDRRDKSILYWKSLPVSELETVVSKYLFAATAFIFVATIIALINSVLLYGLFHFGFEQHMQEQPQEAGFTIMQLIVWPLMVIGITGIWSAPWFAWALFVSAYSRRFPILLFVLVPMAIGVMEGFIFRSRVFANFIDTHSPWELLSKMSLNPSIGDFVRQFLVANSGSFLVAMVLSAILLYGAVWCRTHRFEV